VPGFTVDPAALRAAATSIETGAGRLAASAARVNGAGVGATSNPGFATSAVLERLVGQLGTVVQRLVDGQRKCASNLTATADGYERNDTDLETEFRRMWPGT
jgi:Excreted virulence factor EspC, type VII ESX diderm